MAVVKSKAKKTVKEEKILPNPPFTKEGVKDVKITSSSPSPSKGEGKILSLEAKVYSQDGEEAGKIVLPKEIFGVKINSDLIAQSLRAQAANSRDSIAHAKDRSEVRGGGKKPWKQKGTGRARHASIRSPLWAGGGVTFGPRKERNFSVKINRKMKRQALLMALSGKIRDGELVILENLELAQPKTKEMAAIISKVAAGAAKELNKGTMIILSKKDERVIRAAKNLPKISTMGVASLNIMDLLSTKYLVMPKDAVEKISQIYKK